MTTLQSNHNISPETTITARMSATEWAKVIGLVVTAAATCALWVSSVQETATRADKRAEDAWQQSATVKNDFQTALVALSAKLGRIEGLLDRIAQETHK